MVNFMKQDSSTPDFWQTHYQTKVTPWDAGGVPQRLKAFLRDRTSGQKLLIPGCGSGYEIAAFALAGHDVTAIDFAEAAVERARKQLGTLPGRVILSDFFAADLPESGFDLVYERTFLCALPRRLWEDYAARVASLLRPGGELAGFFYFAVKDTGPPFGLKEGELQALLAPYFVCAADELVPEEQSVPVLSGGERWMIWKRSL